MSELSSATLGGRDLVQVLLPCADLERSKAFYSDTLRLPFLFETNRMAFYQLGNARLMLGELREGQPAMAGGGIYLDAPDLPAVVRAMQARGIEFHGPAQVLQQTPQSALTLQSLLDPDGNLVALMGVVPA
jgi:predicted enzyme related to lactoylglutathione lyase